MNSFIYVKDSRFFSIQFLGQHREPLINTDQLQLCPPYGQVGNLGITHTFMLLHSNRQYQGVLFTLFKAFCLLIYGFAFLLVINTE